MTSCDMEEEPTSKTQFTLETNPASEDLYVVTENGEQCFLWRSNQLTYIAQERCELPAILASKFGALATRLDLSYNSLTSFANINSFTNLNELILDNNSLEDDQLEFALNLRLKTLSLNKNKLTNLYKLVNTIKVRLPNLEYLSLIGNPLCPGPRLPTTSPIAGGEPQLTNGRAETPTTTNHTKGGNNIDELVLRVDSSPIAATSLSSGAQHSNEFSQQKYRHFIIYHLPNLKFLDSRPISAQERDEALRRCFWMSQASATVDTREQFRPNSSLHRQRHHSENSADSAAGAEVEAATNGAFRLTIMSGNANTNTNNGTEQQQEAPRGVFSRLAYKYTGRNSEGNRFIRNQDL